MLTIITYRGTGVDVVKVNDVIDIFRFMITLSNHITVYQWLPCIDLIGLLISQIWSSMTVFLQPGIIK